MNNNILLEILTSIFNVIVTPLAKYLFSHRGKLNVFYKRESPSHSIGKYGIIGNYLVIPMSFDLQNTSRINKVCRDLSLWLYKDNKPVKKFSQVKDTYQKNERTKEITNECQYGNDVKTYSFNIDQKSVKSIRCFFMINKSQIEAENQIVLAYYDENDKQHLCKLFEAKEILDSKTFEPDSDWVKADADDNEK